MWACFDTTNADFWNAAVTSGREFFHNAIDSNGVIGDQSSFTGQTTKGAGADTKGADVKSDAAQHAGAAI